NTMTMAIYERTREIGVMKVLGCELGNIRTMFLLESSCISRGGWLPGR
ncbi:ABC transporter permease, partial [Gemmiger formicilis]|nr:ABC transporter permease [Gemmiger formicilis]